MTNCKNQIIVPEKFQFPFDKNFPQITTSSNFEKMQKTQHAVFVNVIN
jgi:hypothetical protein